MQPCNVLFYALPNQRLASGNTNFSYSEAHEDSRQAIQLRPGQNLIVIAIIFRIGRAAIDAAEIAAVGHRDAQVGNLAPEFVVQEHQIALTTWSPKNKKPESICLDAGADEKLHIFVVGSFPSGEAQPFPAKPSFPVLHRDIAPAAIGFLPVGAKGRSLSMPSLTLCCVHCNSVQSLSVARY